ncbi:MAG: hypothetical protein R3C28_09900 [Pirellulaceae bacterium]
MSTTYPEDEVAPPTDREAQTAEVLDAESVVIPDAEAAPEPESQPVVNPCPQCGTGRDNYPVCRSCGWYELINSYVEIDAQMEFGDGQMDQPQPFRVPYWAYGLGGILCLIFVESIVAAVILPLNHPHRMIWSVVQLFFGLIAVVAGQLRAAFLSTMDNADAELNDCIMHPIKVWSAVTKRLPKTVSWLALGSGGLLAVVMSLFVIRSIPYDKIWETDGPPPKVKDKLIGAIADAAKASESDMTMEEAMNDLANKAVPEEEEEEEEVPRDTLDGVILGFYQTTSEDSQEAFISSVLIGTVVDGKLVIFGTVGLGLDEVRDDLTKKLFSIIRPTPFVPSDASATWVEPKILCQISYKPDKKGNVTDMRFEKFYK